MWDGPGVREGRRQELGERVAHEFVGGLDPYGNPLLSEKPDVGAIQVRGKHDIFGPLTGT